jgi:hypothetical protein
MITLSSNVPESNIDSIFSPLETLRVYIREIFNLTEREILFDQTEITQLFSF